MFLQKEKILRDYALNGNYAPPSELQEKLCDRNYAKAVSFPIFFLLSQFS